MTKCVNCHNECPSGTLPNGGGLMTRPSCGSVYRVSRRRADEGRLNWFACPGGKHGRTQD